VNTKEAIEGLEKIIKRVYRQEYSDYLEGAIERLQRGEKFEAIYKEAVKYFNSIDDNIIKELEQKYFPKPKDEMKRLLKELEKKIDYLLRTLNV